MSYTNDNIISTMNNIIMDYLIVSGHKEAAEKFARESGTERKH